MLDLLKQAVYTGVGLAVLTRDKVEELGKDLARQAKLSEQEGKKLVDDMVARSQQLQKDVEARTASVVAKVQEKQPLATKGDLARVEARLAELEAKVASLKPSGGA